MKFTKFVAAAILAGCAISTYADEEGPKVGGYAGADLKNGYLSNGYLFADDSVLQSYAGITFAGFDFNVWNSWDIDQSHFASADASNEIDYEIDYYGSCDAIKNFDYMLGIAAWVYPNTDDSFDEWVGKINLGYDAQIVKIGLNSRFGLESQQGYYGQLKFSRSFAMPSAECLSLDVYGLVGYASKSYRKGKGVDENGFVDFEAGASISAQLNDSVSACCGVTYSALIDGDLRDAVDSGDAFMADGKTHHIIHYVGISAGF